MLRRFCSTLLQGQQGLALMMTLGLLFSGTAVVVGALVLASTASISSRLSIDSLKRMYAAMGGSEYINYLLVYDPGFEDGLEAGVPFQTTITVGDEEVDVTVVKVADSPPLPGQPPAEDGREFYVTKEVTPTSAEPNTPTTYTYTISIKNADMGPVVLKSIHDRPPEGFSYVAGSSSGITSNNPTITGGEMTWGLGPTFVTFQPGETKTQTFHAQASVPEGNYGNEAWVSPGDEKTSTDLTAGVIVGSPQSSLWQGPHATLTEAVDPAFVPAETESTVTYTITLTNTGTDVLNLTLIRDLLPPGGLTYVAGTTSGLTTQNPNITVKEGPTGDRLQLEWPVSVAFQPGEEKTMSFQASGILAPGDYFSDAWAWFNEIPVSKYTWPTAQIKAMGVFDTEATDGDTTVASRVWYANGVTIRASWSMSGK